MSNTIDWTQVQFVGNHVTNEFPASPICVKSPVGQEARGTGRSWSNVTLALTKLLAGYDRVYIVFENAHAAREWGKLLLNILDAEYAGRIVPIYKGNRSPMFAPHKRGKVHILFDHFAVESYKCPCCHTHMSGWMHAADMFNV